MSRREGVCVNAGLRYQDSIGNCLEEYLQFQEMALPRIAILRS
jgi:hypothetical protein